MNPTHPSPQLVDANGNAQAAAIPNSDAGISPEAMSGLSYFCGIAAIVALCVDPFKKDPRVRYNAVQALLFHGTALAGYIILGIVSAVMGMILSFTFGALHLYALSGLVMTFFSVLTGVYGLGMFGTWVYLIIAGASGKTPKLPFLGAYAVKFSKS